MDETLQPPRLPSRAATPLASICPDLCWKTFPHALQIDIHADSIRWNCRGITRWRCEFAPCCMLFGCPAAVDFVAKDGRRKANVAQNLVFLRNLIPRLRCNRLPASPMFSLCSAIVHMSVPLTENLLPPRCEICDIGTVRIGKLPPIGLRPLVYVYKCDACNQITSVEPGRQEDDSRRRVTAIRRPRR